MKSHLNYITINDDNLIKVDISLKLNGANIKQLKEQCNNNDTPKYKGNTKIQVPKCTASSSLSFNLFDWLAAFHLELLQTILFIAV
jgi:hypothetical protein